MVINKIFLTNLLKIKKNFFLTCMVPSHIPTHQRIS